MKRNQKLSGEKSCIGADREVRFELDKNVFRAPFTCHGKTRLENKKISLSGTEFSYSVWKCKKCRKEYLDSEQGKRLEKFWIVKNLLEDSPITMKRNMNYDGKTYFFRFPKELSMEFHKNDLVNIKLLTSDGRTLLVEIKSREP